MTLLASLFGHSPPSGLAQAPTILDVVTATAELASNPGAIEVILDKVRSVTSRLQPDQPLSNKDEDTLLDVYLQLEHYLGHDDPIRAFDPEKLREQVNASLREQIIAYEARQSASLNSKL